MSRRWIPSSHSRQRIADLSFGTMNLQTIAKNNAFVEDKPQVAGKRRHLPREDTLPRAKQTVPTTSSGVGHVRPHHVRSGPPPALSRCIRNSEQIKPTAH